MKPQTRAALNKATSKPTTLRLFSLVAALCIALSGQASHAQQNPLAETPQQELEHLKTEVDKAQAQVDASQQQLLELKKSLALLEQRLGAANQAPATTEAATAPMIPPPPATLSADAQEHTAMQDSQIATLNQIKVESQSKYPVKISGLILLNGFVNTSQVDDAAAPTVAVAGSGSTGASLRQTVLGIDARGPTLAGAASHADVRVDFFGSSASHNACNARLERHATFCGDGPADPQSKPACIADGDCSAGPRLVRQSLDVEPAGRRRTHDGLHRLLPHGGESSAD
jgi:hypothetical protein